MSGRVLAAHLRTLADTCWDDVYDVDAMTDPAKEDRARQDSRIASAYRLDGRADGLTEDGAV